MVTRDLSPIPKLICIKFFIVDGERSWAKDPIIRELQILFPKPTKVGWRESVTGIGPKAYF
jgi:hypothetical protein